MSGPRSTTQMRAAWSPACTGPWAVYTFWTGVKVSVRPAIIPAVKVLDAIFEKHGYKPTAPDCGAYNCLGGDTQVITKSGWRKISELAGTTAELLVKDPYSGGSGRWVAAPVNHFGVQPTYDVVVERYGVSKKITATADHRWFVRSEGGPVREVTTSQLQARDGRKGDRLASVKPQSVASRTKPSDIGIMAGLVYGDGTLYDQGSKAYLVGTKDAQLEKYFPEGLTRYNHDDTLSIVGLPKTWKNGKIDLEEGSPFLYGWLAGYFAADGRVSQQGTAELSSSEKWRLEQAREVALRLGIATSPITSVERKGFDKEETTLYSLRFDARSLDPSFFLIEAHRSRWNMPVKASPDWSVVSVTPGAKMDVYCATVDETGTFAIEDFLLTGNCRKITGGTGYSLHSYGIAIDINWQDNPYQPNDGSIKTDMPRAMIDEINQVVTFSGARVWRCGIDYTGRNVDPMHFEIVCTPAELATGISGVQTPTPNPNPTPTPEEPKGPLMALSDKEQQEVLDKAREDNLILKQLQKIILGDNQKLGDTQKRQLDSLKRIEQKIDSNPPK